MLFVIFMLSQELVEILVGMDQEKAGCLGPYSWQGEGF